MAFITALTENDAAGLEALRAAAYRSGEHFSLTDPAPLLWSKEDEDGVVLAAYERPGFPIATMRGCLGSSRAATQKLLECDWRGGAADSRSLVLQRGASHPDHVGRGLNNALRYWFLRLAVDWSVDYVLGTLSAAGRRIPRMRSYGYRFEDAPSSPTWVETSQGYVIGVLDFAKDGAFAIGAVYSHSRETIHRFPLTGVVTPPASARRTSP